MAVIVIKKKIISIFCALMVCVGCLGSPAYATSDARLLTDLQQMPKEFWKALQGAWDGLQSDKGACPNCGNTDISSSLLGCPECGASGWVTYNGKDTEIDLGSLFGGGGSSGVGAGRDSIRFATPVIGPRGYKRYYLKMESYISDPPSSLVIAADKSYLTNYRLANMNGSISDAWYVNCYRSTSNYLLYYCPSSWVLPSSGTYQYGTNVEVLSGFVREDFYLTSPALGVGTVLDYYLKVYATGLAGDSIARNVKAGNSLVLYGAENKQLGGYYGSFVKVRYFAELIADEYGVSVDYSVVNNNYINIENKTITVNNQEINYNNAYYENNVYYVYTNDEKVTTYITNDNGDIIGECTYNPDTGSYTIKLYNYEPPKATATPAPTASPAPTEAPSATDAPDNGGSGGDNSGSNGSNGGDNSGSNGGDNSGSNGSNGGDNSGSSGGSSDDDDSGGGWLSNLFQDLLKKLFEGIVDGLLAVLKAALGVILKLLTSLFLLIPLFSKALGFIFPFIPLSVLTIMTSGFALILILTIVKFIRGFF